jgi:ubiquinone/menaquinone biosynthesis C-methylase UbiE
MHPELSCKAYFCTAVSFRDAILMAGKKHGAHAHRFSAEGDLIERLEGPERSALLPREVIIPRMELGGGETLVDLGSGVGFFSIPISKKVGRVISIDIEPKMHEVLSSRIRADGLGNIDLIRAEITDIPLADASVDRVLAAFVYHELDSPRELMVEGARVLRDGGVMTVIDFQKKDTPIGPPVAERKSPAQVIRSAPRSMEMVSRFDSDVYYQLAFRRR